jgi:acyl-CoA synthetase (NDP forming)
MTSTAPTITLRAATPADAPALDRLAALDSRTVPAGELLVAVRDGRLAAAVAVDSLDAISDPFQRTADAVALLRRQATGRRAARPARSRLRLVPRAA